MIFAWKAREKASTKYIMVLMPMKQRIEDRSDSKGRTVKVKEFMYHETCLSITKVSNILIHSIFTHILF